MKLRYTGRAWLAPIFLFGTISRCFGISHTWIHQPAAELKCIEQAMQEFSQQVSQRNLLEQIAHNPHVGMAELTKFVDAYAHAKHPFFMLGECQKTGHWAMCPLSREQNPGYRTAFEDRVVTQLMEQYTQGDKRVVYVGFCSGGMFQDLLILSRFLQQAPDAQVIVHLIDREYLNLAWILHFLGSSSQVHSGPEYQMMALVNKQNEFVSAIRAAEPRMSLSDSEIWLHGLSQVQMEMQAKQFIRYLTHGYPQAGIKLYVHGHVEQYMSCMKDKQLEHADIISVADIADEISDICNARPDLAKLLTGTVQHKPHATIFLLDLLHDESSEEKTRLRAGVVTMATQQTSELATRIELLGTTLYATTQYL